MLATPSGPLIVSSPAITCEHFKTKGQLLESGQVFPDRFHTRHRKQVLRYTRRHPLLLHKILPQVSRSNEESEETIATFVAHQYPMVIWHSVALSFNECLVSLMTSKCDRLSPWIKEKGPVLHLPQPRCEQSGHYTAVFLSSPLLDLGARLNYPTTSTRVLTAALAGVSFPDALTSPDGKLVSVASHQRKQLTSSTSVPFH